MLAPTGGLQVWDLRTYKLLRSVPGLDGTQLVGGWGGRTAWHLRTAMPCTPPATQTSRIP